MVFRICTVSLLAVIGLAAACGKSSVPSEKTTESTPVPAFDDPLPRWAPFFETSFGDPPGPALVGDFNGDGQTDVATRIGSQLFVFHDTKVVEPKEWETIDVDDDINVEVQPASFAIQRLPSLQGLLSEKQSVFVTGEKSPVIVFWYPKESAYAWLQVVPKELEPARTDAQKRLGVSFRITKNNVFGEQALYGEDHLVEGFVGDFDGDGTGDFLAVETRDAGKSRLYLYKGGATTPSIQDIDYSGNKAALHQNPKLKTIDLPDFDQNQKELRVKPKGAYVEIWNPEKSGVIVVFENEWKMYWVSD